MSSQCRSRSWQIRLQITTVEVSQDCQVYCSDLLTLFTARIDFDQLFSDNRDYEVFINFEGSHLPPSESLVQLGPKPNVSFLLNIFFSATAFNQAATLLLRNGQTRFS